MDTDVDLTFHLQVIKSNTTIPAIILNQNNEIVASINLSKKIVSDAQILNHVEKFKTLHPPIKVVVSDVITHYVFYGESTMLEKIRFYPYYALILVSLFVFVSYF